MTQPGAGPDQRIHRDANLLRDLIGGLKTDAVDVLGKGVGVAAHFLDGVFAVGLVNAHRPAGADPVGMEEYHDVSDDLLLGPRLLDPLPAPGADALDFLQSRGLRLNHVENLFTKLLHQLLGIDRADALDHAAAQIFLDAFLGRGRGAVQHLGPELEAELPILHPAAFRRHPFTRTYRWQGANDSDLIALSLGLDL